MTFMGYRRADGTAGTRNHILILPTVACANQVTRSIARQVQGTVWVEHQHGCSQLAPDAAQTARVFVGHGIHPNVFGIVVVGLGCEGVRAQDVAAEIRRRCPYKPVHCVIIQDAGGSLSAIAAGARAAEQIVKEASRCVREPIPVAELILGTACGGSDASSGLSANPALGEASDLLVDAGGTAVLSETPELIGAEHLVAARAVNKEVAERCYELVRRCEEGAKALGVDMRGSNPSPGNIEGGLTTIEEKSLGCIYKGGTRPLVSVFEYAEQIDVKGLVYMDTPGNDVEQLTGMVAGGCNVIVFTTGRGTPTGSPIVPTVKVAANSELFRKMADNMDLNAGTVVTGEETVKQVGQRIFAEMIEVASGRLTKAEIMGQNDFGINRIGPSM
ncbi:MAG: UxaA family hydrolase [Negativicutes bacterium]|nr:UxaA family hydrolase [Negativicutes bacterium]